MADRDNRKSSKKENKNKVKEKKDKKNNNKKSSLGGLKARSDVIDELQKKAKESNVKVFSLSFKPLTMIVSIIILALLIYGYFRLQSPEGVEVTVGEFVQNIKKNKYSEVVIQDTGKAIGASKYVHVVDITGKDRDDISKSFKDDKKLDTDVVNMESAEFRRISLSEFVSIIIKPEWKKLLENTTKKESNVFIETIVVDDDFIIGKTRDFLGGRVSWKDGGDLLVEDVGIEKFKTELTKQAMSLEELDISVVEMKSASESNEFDSFEKEIENGMYSDVWVLENEIVALLHPYQVSKFLLDTDSLKTDFPQLLQDEGVMFDNDQVKMRSESVTTIDIGLIFQILSMLFIGFVVISILRGINGSGKGLMQFGKSKAKMFFGKKPEVTFEDVAGIDSAKEELNEIVLFLRDPRRFLKLGARIPKGLLMVGPPGTGKTLLARAIAGEAKVPFFHTSGSEFEEMLVGAGASRVRDLFAKAMKASPALVFIDEIDAVARKRGTTVQSSSTEQTLNQILVEMDGFEKNTNVIVIAATNRPDVLDPAILRPGRFDRRIVIDLPDIKGREEILKIHAKNKPLADGLSLRKVARRTVGYSGADLENILNEAAIIVAKDNRKEITFDDVEEAANRVAMGRERKIERSKKELKKTAYHEAGHAIVAKLTPESDPVHRITIVSRGMALGSTMQLPEKDKYSQSYVELESKLKVLLAGRASEEIVYGKAKITSGAANDIEKATKLARKMVKSYGYSSKLGLVKYGESNELQYLGYGYGDMRDFSDKTARIIDEEVKRVIDESYQDAVSILNENEDLLEKIAVDLLEKEIIEGDEFDKYFKDKEDRN